MSEATSDYKMPKSETHIKVLVAGWLLARVAA